MMLLPPSNSTTVCPADPLPRRVAARSLKSHGTLIGPPVWTLAKDGERSPSPIGWERAGVRALAIGHWPLAIRRRRRAFTLIELLLVLVILGILAAITSTNNSS